ncbi:MAG: winged helix-turn-helix domain-containing protein [Alphaproteobacteria bacterium]
MIYRFAEFALDTELYELRRGGEPVAVEPQVFSLLLHLIENRDHVVSKDDLIAAVWHGRIVSDATLSSRINAARRAVGDNGKAQAVIRTTPRRGFRCVGEVISSGDAPARAAEDPAPLRRLQEKPSLAVLPFKNLGATEDDEYFSDGLTEDIITELSRFRELQVIARNSTFRFKGRALDMAQIGAELHAGYVVEGSVRRAGARVRITAQLIDAATGVHLWGDRYDRDMEDIFAVQDEVTRTIAATLGVRLQDVALERALKKSPAELDAYDCVLRARRYTSSLSEEMHAEARDLLEKAIALDPAYADAHALLANVYLAEHRFEANPRPDPVGRALAMAQTATRLDPQNAYAHCWLAIVHFFRGENEQFEAEARRALGLNPNDPEILADIGHYFAFMGAFERGTELTRRAQQLNPLHPGWYNFSFARYHYDQGAYADTLADVERISLPNFYWARLLEIAALGQLDSPEAPASLAEIFQLKPDFSARAELKKWNAAPHDFEHILDGLRKAGLDE